MSPETIIIALLNLKPLLPISEIGHLYGRIIDLAVAHFTAIEPEDVSKHRYNAFTSDGILKGKCPNCWEYVTEDEDWCHKCGQHLDWSKYKKE